MLYFVNPTSRRRAKNPKRRKPGSRPPGVRMRTGTRAAPKSKPKKGSSMPKRNPARKRKTKPVVKGGKKLYGAAAKAVTKKRAAAKRKVRKAYKGSTAAAGRYAAGATAHAKKAAKKRPARKRKAATATRKKVARRPAAAKKKTTRKRKRRVARVYKSVANLKTARINPKRRKSMAKAKRRRKRRTTTARRRVRRRRANPKRRVTRRRSTAKRRVKRRANPKRRVTRRRRSTAKRRRRRNPAPRRAYVRSRRRKATKRYGRGVRAVSKARRTLWNTKAHGSGLARGTMKRFGMRSNPLGGMVDSIKKAFPIAVSLYGARVVSRKVLPLVPGLSALGRFAPAAGAGLLIVAASYLTRKGGLRKYRDTVMLGLGLNAIDVLANTFMPANVKAMVGLSDAEPLYDGAMGEYVAIGEYESEMGEYVSIGAEEELGEYVSIGAEEELGSLGDGAFLNQGIGTGIGMPSGELVKGVPQRAMVAPVPQRSFVKNVPPATAAFDNLSDLYTGIFRGGY